MLSESANLRLRNVPNLLLRDVEKVEHAIVAHHCQAAVSLIEGNSLYSLIHLDLR